MRAGTITLFFVFATSIAAGASTPAFAEGCDELRLDGPKGSMEHVKVRDQGDFNTCAPTVAAEMADAYRFTHDPPVGDRNYDFVTSGLEAAFGTAVDQKVTFKDALDDSGGIECDAAKYLRDHQACDNRVLTTDQALAEDTTFLAKSYDAQDDLTKHLRRAPGETRSLIRETCNLSDTDLRAQGLYSNTKAMLAILKTLTTQRENEAFAAFQTDCKKAGRAPVRYGACDGPSIDPLHPKDSLDAILVHLNRAEPVQPLSVGICAAMLRDGHAYRGYSKPRRGDDDGYHTASDCENHSVLVIGKRPSPKTGKCQLLVQNSWGTDCDGYAPDWIKDCDQGKVWIDADALTRNMYDMNYLE